MIFYECFIYDRYSQNSIFWMVSIFPNNSLQNKNDFGSGVLYLPIHQCSSFPSKLSAHLHNNKFAKSLQKFNDI